MKTKEKLLAPRLVRSLLVPREADSHKGNFGHVLVIAGGRGMTGAAVLCSGAAIRSGAGLVTAAIPESQYDAFVCRSRPEVMSLPLPEGKYGSISPKALPAILKYMTTRRVSSLVIGPGMGCNPDSGRLVRSLVAAVPVPVVLDADAITVLAAGVRRGIALPALARAAEGIIMTPHPGEFSRISGFSPDEIRRRRQESARAFARDNGVVCVLKGFRTVITAGDEVYINTTGNPGMATGGSGDVLAGMIAALSLQVREPRLLNAAICAVYLHGFAGDLAAKEKTAVGMVAGDIVDAIPAAAKKVLKP